MPARWIAARAVAAPMASRSSAAPERGPSRCTICCKEGPATYSLTMYGRPCSTPVSSTAAVQNGATRLATSASRRNRATLTESSDWSPRSHLTATRVSPSTARYTTPWPPSPSRPRSSRPPRREGSPGTSGE